MYNKLLFAIILFGLIIVGFVKTLYKIRKYVVNYNFVGEYSSKVNNLLNETIIDEDYSYILSNIEKLSHTMGHYAIMDYKPPFANYIHKNYNIVNFILNYNDRIMNQELIMALKSMQVYLGACENEIEELKKCLKNPFKLFAEGFRFIFNTPLFILESLGIISTRMYYRIKVNTIYYFIQRIAGLIGFVSAVVGTIQGKEVLFNIYNKGSKLITSIFK
ncbi:hypothetical protein [Clostridium scatologenes]|uniref:Uncharacterized protein n=1 Tax=Clostridium scatologenes TaxID=1548 RepID=A0A0E3MA00_CLOSL|nr:hypothetical protein [Clostridium scatologenes]AKA70147.1 hypothetical protein CSCA_3022 [Clostridium scatologenes]